MQIHINPVNIMPVLKAGKAKPSFKSEAAPDIFERTVKPSSEMQLISEIFGSEKSVEDSISEIIKNPENQLGKGFFHRAYIIPDNDDYILRVNNYAADNLDFENIEIKDTGDKNLHVNIGQEVARIQTKGKDGSFGPIIEVLRKQNGKSLGIPPSQAIYIEDTGKLRPGEISYSAAERKQYYADTIHMTAQMPLEAYENLIETYKQASEAGYTFDHLNSNNILIDTENQSINTIDWDKSSRGADYGNLLYALTNCYYFSTFVSNYDEAPVSDEAAVQALKDSLEIIDKFTKAMQNKNVKFDRENYSYEFLQFLSSTPCSYFCKSYNDREKWQKFSEMGIVK